MSIATTTSEIAAATEVGRLAANRLALPEAIAQSIGAVAPSGTPALVIPVVFAAAGNGTWLAYLFATVALLFVAWNVNQFAKRTVNPGALYVFAGQGLGAFWGVVAGWALLIAYLFTAAAVIGGSVNSLLAFAHRFGLEGLDHTLSVTLSLLVILGAWALAYRDIKLSTRTTLVIELVTVALIVAVIASALAIAGPVVDHAQLSLEGAGAEQLRLGLVLAFFSFVGFESATTLGAETRDPRRSIPRAVFTSVVAIGVLFVFSAYGLTATFHDLPVTLDKAEAPLSFASYKIGAGFVGPVIDLGVALSFFACALGSINAGARVLFALSGHGLFHAAAGTAHRTNATPHVAVTALAVIAAVLSVALTVAGYGLLDTFGLLGTVATYGFLTAYILVAAATPFFLREVGVLKPWHFAVSVITILLLSVPLVGSLYPAPAWPLSALPYVFGALLLAGVGWFLALKAKSPASVRTLYADLLNVEPDPGAVR